MRIAKPPVSPAKTKKNDGVSNGCVPSEFAKRYYSAIQAQAIQQIKIDLERKNNALEKCWENIWKDSISKLAATHTYVDLGPSVLKEWRKEFTYLDFEEYVCQLGYTIEEQRRSEPDIIEGNKMNPFLGYRISWETQKTFDRT